MKKLLLFLFFSQFIFAQQWSIPFAERSALINIYNTASGDAWSQTWDFNKDPKNWYGIKIKNGNVTEINLRGNALKGSFPTGLSVFTKLQKLDLSSNQLSGELSSEISALTDLVRLDVSNNRLTGDPTATILPLTNLTELSLGNNNFIFNDINALLQNFLDLKVLDLSHIGLTSVPSKIIALTKLESLNLSNNEISQNFSNLSPLEKLTELNLSGNKLTIIPSEISSLNALITLDLSRNLFSKGYSAPLVALKKLEWLSLANNQIDVFPTELFQLLSLIHLNIADNKITGGTESLATLKNLEQIFLDKNLLTGEIPASLLKLEKLQMVSLTGNQLSGEIPDNIPSLTFLENNRFTRQQIKNFILKQKKLHDFIYSPQRYDDALSVHAPQGSTASLPQSLSGNTYQFRWYKDLDQKTSTLSENYTINKTENADYTDYTCEAYVFEELPNALLEISFFREPVTLVKSLSTAEVKGDLVVYPNPVKDYINIRSSKLNIEKVFIFDLSGKLLMTEKSTRINVSHLPSAAYIISIKTPDSIQSFKFLKH